MLLRKILFPVAVLNYLFQLIRSFLYANNFFKVYHPKINTICIGNLSLGGTGKTPLVKFLIERLSKKINISVLSRGYKRKTKGFIEVLDDSDVNDVGDENFMIKKSFKNINVFSSENRSYALDRISKKFNDIGLIILDDAMQHRKIKCDVNIMLTKFDQPFYNDFIFPFGNLREPRIGYERANVIIVNKCPKNLTSTQKEKIIKKINPLDHQRIFFSKVHYEDILKGKNDVHISVLESDFVLVTGIADSSELEKFLKKNRISFDHLKFNDHHKYSDFDINTIKSKSIDNKVITTKKDYYKIINNQSIDNIYYIDIKVKFLNDENNFKSEILNTFK